MFVGKLNIINPVIFIGFVSKKNSYSDVQKVYGSKKPHSRLYGGYDSIPNPVSEDGSVE